MKFHPIFLLIGFYALVLLADIVQPGIIRDLVTRENRFKHLPTLPELVNR